MAENDSTVEYRDVQGFPGYRVGSDGSVWSEFQKTVGRKFGRSGNWRMLKPKPSRGGYLRVQLYRDGKSVYRCIHHLVLEAFVGPRPDGMEACHDPDPTPANNALANLRWDTRSNNNADKIKHGTHQAGEKNPAHRLTNELVYAIRAQEGLLSSHKTAARFAVPQATVWRIWKRSRNGGWATLPEQTKDT